MATITEKPPPTPTTRGAGPLTTVFTMPDFCQSLWWRSDAVGTPAVSSSICMPGNWVAYFGNRSGMYSPGICPSGYTVGCQFPTADARVEGGKIWAGGPVEAGETAQICCPESYTCFHDTTTEPAVQWRKCITAGPNSMTRYTATDGQVVTTEKLAYAIQVRWQSSDLSILETDPTVPGSTYTTPAPSATPPNAGNGDVGDGGSGSGSGGGGASTTIIVVGVVVPAVSLILAIIGFLFWRHHYRAKYKYKRTGAGSSTTALKDLAGSPRPPTAQTELGGGGGGFGSAKEEEKWGGGGGGGYYASAAAASEMDAAVVHEADGRAAAARAELPATDAPHEMPAVFVAELADTAVPARRQAEVATTTANDLEGPASTANATARRTSLLLRDAGRRREG